MKKTIKKLIEWREKKRLKRISDMSADTAFLGMIICGFCGSFYALFVSKFYLNFILLTNKEGIFNFNAIIVGIILSAAALAAFGFGLIFQICNKVYIEKIFEEDNKTISLPHITENN